MLIGYCNVLFCGSLQSFCCVDISRRYFTSFSVVVLPQIQDNYCICRQLSERSSHILSDCSLALHHLCESTPSSIVNGCDFPESTRSSLPHRRLESASPEEFHHLRLRRQIPESSYILSDCSLALYPPEFNSRHCPLQMVAFYLRQSTQPSFAIPFYSRTACTYEGVNRVIISFFVNFFLWLQDSAPIEHVVPPYPHSW